MHVYKLSPHADAKSQYFGTLAKAQAEAKPYMMYADRADLRVFLIDVESDKDALLGYLNFGDQQLDGEVLRVWCLSPRGALHELPREVIELNREREQRLAATA